ncbi:alpha/beta hydrolase [Lysobacter humi (ex Lee et al. 2017)]
MRSQTDAPRPGELVHEPAYVFAFRSLEPAPDPPSGLLVLLHGVDGDETQLAGIGAAAPPGTWVVLPRGPRSISGDRIGWYRVGLSEDGLQIVEDEEAEARARLVEFVAQLQKRHDIPPSRTLLGGFSQGGMLAAGAALDAPRAVAGFAMLAGHPPPGIDAPHPRGDMAHLHALVAHGRDDGTLPLADAEAAARRLSELGVRTRLHIVDGDHLLTRALRDEAVAWIGERLGDGALSGG